MNHQEFINLISFCVLMENGDGILAKSPRYLLEKYEHRHIGMLDQGNQMKLFSYRSKWDNSLKKMEGYPGD